MEAISSPASVSKTPGHPPGTLFLLFLLGLCAACGGESAEPGEAQTYTDRADTARIEDRGERPEERKGGRRYKKEEKGPASLETGYDLSALRVPDAPASGDGVLEGPEPASSASEGVPGLSLLDGHEPSKDFGQLVQGSVAEHVFQLVSDGEGPLVVSRIKPSCGCTIARTSLLLADGRRSEYEIGTPIEPGTQVEVQAELKTQGRVGPMSSNISVYSNAPAGVMNLSLKAEVKPVLIADPSATINFNRITTADVVRDEIRIKSAVLEPFLLKVDEQFQTEPLKVELSPVDPADDGRSTDWKLSVELGPGTPEGVRNFPIRLVSDVPVPGSHGDSETQGAADDGHDHGSSPVHELRCYVQAQVTSMVSATPGFVSFGMVRPGQVVERTVLIRCHDDFELDPALSVRIEGLRSEEFALADSFATTLTPLEDGVLELKLELLGLPEEHQGSFGGVVRLAIGHPLKEELQVRFSGVCRAGLPSNPAARAVQDPAGSSQGG